MTKNAHGLHVFEPVNPLFGKHHYVRIVKKNISASIVSILTSLVSIVVVPGTIIRLVIVLY